MKKLLYILSLLVLSVSCTNEIIDPVENLEGNKVKIDFSVQLPDMTPATKAMADQPAGQLKSLHLAVFDDAGYLAEYIMASPDLAQENGKLYAYTAKVSMSSTPRIIHFIGNGPSSVRFGTEEEVMARINASENEDLYWYRKVLPSITGVNAGAGLAELAETDTELQIDDITRENLSNIPLVRNFVKIVLEDGTGSEDDFVLEKYAVVNSLNSGMLAAYDAKTGNFIEYFNYVAHENEVLSKEGVMQLSSAKTYDQLIGEGYDANIPSNASFISPAEAWGTNGANAVAAGQPFFVYEREKPVSNPTFIIAYGNYQGENYYYKIDLRDDKGAYFPLLRNFAYTLTLTKVERAGYETIEEAVNSAGSGDISTALETISLVYISDGVASLEVEYTEKVVTTADPVTLDFTFLTDVSDNSSYGDPSSITVQVNNDYGLSGAAISSALWDGKNPGKITITPTTPTAAPKSQSITIYAVYKKDGIEKTLQRTVRYVVMTKRTMTAVCIPNEVPNTRGSEFALEITIPGGLSSGMFPLEFQIEAKKLTITPNTTLDHMPVESGVSLSGSGSAFHFSKTLEWKDYDPLAPQTSFLCYFKTNTDVSASDIYVANPYFETAQTYLGNYDPKYFQNLTFSEESIVIGEDEPFTFTFGMSSLPSQGNITVTLDGAEPDPNSTNDVLTFIGINSDGKAQYSYAIPPNAGLTGHTLNLITSTNGSPVTVTLDGHQFIQNLATIKRHGTVQFTGLNLENAKVGVGETTTFTFTYDASASGCTVIMTLNGLKPLDGDGIFGDCGDNNDNTWTFTPNTSSRSQSINLQTTTFGTGISVTLQAEDYGYALTEPVAANRVLVIPKGQHENNISSASDIRVCLSNPGNNWNGGNSIGTIRMDRIGAVNDYFIELNIDINPDTKIYLQYRTQGFIGLGREYYVATVTAETLINGGPITWEEQK